MPKYALKKRRKVAPFQIVLPSFWKAKFAEKSKKLEEANAHLQSLNELKDEFIAVTSHELRSPVTNIRGYLSFLVEQASRDGVPYEMKDYLMKAYNNVNVLNDLINNILDASRIDNGLLTLQLKKMDFIQLVESVIENASYQATEKKVRVEFTNLTGEDFLPLSLDEVRLRQVLRNILDNALKYSEAGQLISFVLTSEAKAVHLAIRDQGPGIPKDQLSLIFEKFVQAKRADVPAKGGAGLGLYISLKIAELHGGKISVESEKNKGTVFTLHLPRI